MRQRIWFERVFDLGLALEAQLELVERLRGTPARLEERLDGLSEAVLRSRDHGGWSIQEQVGHLIDLEELWERRLDDFDSGAGVLEAADLENRRTDEAGHNEEDRVTLLGEFRRVRANFVRRLEEMTDAELERTALHPRLEQPMSVVDLCYFVAEHDDHHLATITRLMRARGETL